ncbi:MAG: 2-amino-4-hydroxy-6-hydroxymethyldihydropteridine diphosphokinase [Burkholderiales bacterium]
MADNPQHTAYVALGSNLANPLQQMHFAFEELARIPRSRLVARSSLYRSAPVGYLDQPDFINAVAQLETQLEPRALLAALLEIERRHGRIRDFANAPRTLDLDLLLYGDLIHHEHGLTLPHPRMHERAFVLRPLNEIAPDCVIPGIGRVADLLTGCTGQKLEKLTEG